MVGEAPHGDQAAATVGGKIFVVSAPSGTGKTTLNRRLTADHPEIEIAVSYTTRRPRAGEVEGVHYHFISPAEFQGHLAQGEMLEHAAVFGTLYGTSRAEIQRIHGVGHCALLEIDVQGWRQAKPKLPNALSVFILPPSVAALWQRLVNRGTESEEGRWRRFMTARSEIAAGELYDGFIVNHELDSAYRELEGLLVQGQKPQLSKAQGTSLCAALLKEFDEAPWIAGLAPGGQRPPPA